MEKIIPLGKQRTEESTKEEKEREYLLNKDSIFFLFVVHLLPNCREMLKGRITQKRENVNQKKKNYRPEFIFTVLKKLTVQCNLKDYK